MTDLEIYRSTVLQIFGQENHKLVLTCRKIVYNEAKPYHVFDNYSVVDIEDKDHALNNTEKQKLLQIYGIEKLVEESSLERSNLMFPLNCYILFQNRDELLKSGAPKKVLDHRGYLLNELDTMSKSERTKVLYASLVFLMIANNNFTDEKLKNKEILNEIFIKCNIYDHLPHSREIREKLQFSENAYVIKTDFGFKFLHDSLFEIFAFHFGQDEDNQSLLLKHIDIEYLANNTYMGGLEEESSERDFQIRIFPNNYKILCNRLFHALQGIIQFELDVRSVNPILTHKCWSNEEFIRILLKTVGKKNIVDLFFKPYRVSKVKPKSRAPGKRSSWLHIQGLLENENYGQTGIPGVPDDGETRLIEWIVFKGHLEFIQSVLTRQGILSLFLFKRKIDPDRLFWLSIYSMNKDMFNFALSEMNHNQIEKHINALSFYLETPLTLACSLGVFEIVKILVEKGANIEKCNIKNESPLFLAIKSGSEEIVHFLLEKNPLIRVEHEMISPFETAMERNVYIFKSVLQKCDVKSTNHDGKTPLHLAAEKGFSDVVENLIDRRANVNAADDNQETPTHIACSKNNKEIVRLLLQAGAHLDALNARKETPLDIALNTDLGDVLQTICIERTLEHFKVLLEQTHYVKKWSNHTMEVDPSFGVAKNIIDTILKKILRNCSVENLKLILEKSEIDGTIVDGKSPLHIAVENDFYDFVDTLVHRGASANARDDSSNTPLHIACYRGNTSIAKLLVKGGANLDVLNLRNESPISVAINNGSEELLQYFLLICPLQKFKDLLELCVSNDSISSDDSRPDVKNSEISDKFPASAGIAAKQGKMLQSLLQTCPVENFAILEEYGQSSFQSDDGKTPVHIATHLGCVDMVKSLIDCGVNINVTDNRNQTPLHIACALDDSKAVQLVETFIQNGANINATDSKN
ncbi:serine/threonine-protein phosphatase 6 regulatory ankyrin repeat subunit A-like [Saccostrea cucullata]|uniref:serine/threonine-protein phosphatase 6 regulatory ankyrin repeat subunit A-like n=1 Tax=Saccostrea cuccullata TaxID=36930 RepID=UPI002ED1F262